MTLYAVIRTRGSAWQKTLPLEAHRRVGLQRRRIDGDPLALQQPTIGQYSQHPTKHFPMRVQIDQAPRPRHRGVVRRVLVQANAHKTPLRPDALEVPDQQRAKVDPRRQRWPPVLRRVELRTPLLDKLVERRCAKFYAPQYGRPSLTPGIYFRSLLIGYFEGIGAERRFVGIGLDENTPDHSTMSRTRRLIDLDTHREVFSWVLGVLADRGLLQGQRIAVDATTLEANAAMRLKRQRLLPRASAGSDHSV